MSIGTASNFESYSLWKEISIDSAIRDFMPNRYKYECTNISVYGM